MNFAVLDAIGNICLGIMLTLIFEIIMIIIKSERKPPKSRRKQSVNQYSCHGCKHINGGRGEKTCDDCYRNYERI